MLAPALFGSAVVMEFGAGTRGSFQAGGTPPVVAVAIAVNPLRRYADVVPPQFVGIVVIQVHGNVHALRLQAEQSCAQLPRKGDGVLLEVVADAEIAQHLEEGEVFVVTHLVDVGRAERLLTAGETATGRGLFSHEEGLERHHSGGSEKKGRITGRNQRGGGHVLVPAFFKELREGSANAVAVRVHTRLRLP